MRQQHIRVSEALGIRYIWDELAFSFISCILGNRLTTRHTVLRTINSKLLKKNVVKCLTWIMGILDVYQV